MMSLVDVNTFHFGYREATTAAKPMRLLRGEIFLERLPQVKGPLRAET